MSELKPCPFCGSDKVKVLNGASWMIEKYRGKVRSVTCLECGVNGGIFTMVSLTEKQAVNRAIKSWNRRADISTDSSTENGDSSTGRADNER